MAKVQKTIHRSVRAASYSITYLSNNLSPSTSLISLAFTSTIAHRNGRHEVFKKVKHRYKLTSLVSVVRLWRRCGRGAMASFTRARMSAGGLRTSELDGFQHRKYHGSYTFVTILTGYIYLHLIYIGNIQRCVKILS